MRRIAGIVKILEETCALHRLLSEHQFWECFCLGFRACYAIVGAHWYLYLPILTSQILTPFFLALADISL